MCFFKITPLSFMCLLHNNIKTRIKFVPKTWSFESALIMIRPIKLGLPKKISTPGGSFRVSDPFRLMSGHHQPPFFILAHKSTVNSKRVFHRNYSKKYFNQNQTFMKMKNYLKGSYMLLISIWNLLVFYI